MNWDLNSWISGFDFFGFGDLGFVHLGFWVFGFLDGRHLGDSEEQLGVMFDGLGGLRVEQGIFEDYNVLRARRIGILYGFRIGTRTSICPF